MRRITPTRLRSLPALATLSLACGGPLDPRDLQLLTGTRLLAVRVETEELVEEDLQLQPGAEALPLEHVTIVPAAVRPGGFITPDELEAEIAPIWIACIDAPDDDLSFETPACLDGYLPTRLADIPVCVEHVAPPQPDDEIPSRREACRIATSPPRYHVPLAEELSVNPRVELTVIASQTGKNSGACADQLLGEQEIGDDCISARHHVRIGPFEALAGSSEDVAPDDVSRNRHFRITGFRATVLDDDDEPTEEQEIPVGGRLTLSEGESAEIEPIVPDEDRQLFPSSDPAESKESEPEIFSASWFHTWDGGALGLRLDEDEEEKDMGPGLCDDEEEDLAVHWTQDKDPKPGDDRLYVFVKDEKNGVAWASLDVVVQ
ncbi:MAG: hypothetical protein V3V08_14410 [Nannocystaceae bacterium]